MNSFIPWIGEKRLMRETLIDMFPKNISRYIEVFGGAGWVLFGSESHAEVEVYNDANSDLVNLFNIVKESSRDLQNLLLDLLKTDGKGFINSSSHIQATEDTIRAALYYILLFNPYSNNMCSAENREVLVDNIKYLSDISDRLSNVVIRNQDFQELIDTYDHPDSLFYLDPPYHGTESYYSVSFNLEDHRRLYECLDQIKGKFILTYNHDSFIEELYSSYRMTSIDVRGPYCIGDGLDYRELIITNI